MSTIDQNNSEVYADDIKGFQSPEQFFASLRPDLVKPLGNVYCVFELTVCFETNKIELRQN